MAPAEVLKKKHELEKCFILHRPLLVHKYWDWIGSATLLRQILNQLLPKLCVMENVYENVRKELKPEAVKNILEKMWTRINEPDNLEKINAAKEEAGNDMIEVMKSVFPLVVDIQVETVGQFGFPRNKEGLREFLIRTNELLATDKQISEMLLRIRYTYLPPYA